MLDITILLIILNLISSIFFRKKYTDGLMTVFLFCLLLIELYCNYLSTLKHISNNIEYNFWFPIEFSFYSFIISTATKNFENKKRQWIAISFYLVYVIFLYVFFQNLLLFSGKAYFIGVIMLFFCCFFKMKEMLFEEKIFHPFKEPFFWLIIGLIIVQSAGIFLFAARDFLSDKHPTIFFALKTLNLYLSNFQYICLLAYFYCKWKFQK